MESINHRYNAISAVGRLTKPEGEEDCINVQRKIMSLRTAMACATDATMSFIKAASEEGANLCIPWHLNKRLVIDSTVQYPLLKALK